MKPEAKEAEETPEGRDALTTFKVERVSWRRKWSSAPNGCGELSEDGEALAWFNREVTKDLSKRKCRGGQAAMIWRKTGVFLRSLNGIPQHEVKWRF